jgi:uncharacterized protein with von Willebrand factor type A (vWA) domain
MSKRELDPLQPEEEDEEQYVEEEEGELEEEEGELEEEEDDEEEEEDEETSTKKRDAKSNAGRKREYIDDVEKTPEYDKFIHDLTRHHNKMGHAITA